MAHTWTDNVHTTAFSPRDYQVELLAAAREKNIIVCLGHNTSKEFIALKLIHELGHELRNASPPNSTAARVTLYLCDDGRSVYNQIFHLTDLSVFDLTTKKNSGDDAEIEANLDNENSISGDDINWSAILISHHVIICTPVQCARALNENHLNLVANINLLVLDDCHLRQSRPDLAAILSPDRYTLSTSAAARLPRILGLAGPLHSAGCPPGHLSAELRQLEQQLHCSAESASDIVTVLRYCNAPVELLLQCAPEENIPASGDDDTVDCVDLNAFLRDLVGTRLAFLQQHRFDPSEIYDDAEFLEEMRGYPDPKAEPLEMLGEFMDVLDELGAWCADRAALSLLQRIEKLKVKTPYERHFLLLCMVSTVFVQVRAHCETAFGRLPNEKERIERYSTSKVHRLLEVLRLFRPTKSSPTIVSSSPTTAAKATKTTQSTTTPLPQPASLVTAATLQQLDELNFEQTRLDGERLQRNLPAALANDKIVVQEITDSLQRILVESSLPPGGAAATPRQSTAAATATPTPTSRFRARSTTGGANAQRSVAFPRHRANWNNYINDPNALCGLLFCESKVVAKILHNLLAEMSRQSDDLAYLTVQFTVDRQANPLTEIKEAENEHRKQEEVLKRFRIHECNLLIGTAVLEEGIDLPKCNLVVRWNAPRTYRSYVQCKGKARAQNAVHIIMVAMPVGRAEGGDATKTVAELVLSPQSQRFICQPSVQSTSAENAATSPVDCECLADDNDAGDVARKNHTTSSTAMHLARLRSVTDTIVHDMAKYKHIEQMLMRQCENIEPAISEQLHADRFTALITAYRPDNGTTTAVVHLGSAVALVNKYCAKLPSDTFTKLTPLWRCARTNDANKPPMFQYTLRLPINSPVKQDILGLPMPTRILARRTAALIACRILHRSGELDNGLQPIGKESFRATEPDWENFELEAADEAIVSSNLEPRPGTTKRRQYYYKRIASVLCDCRPRIQADCYLYLIKMTLECPIPEEQNTRGRRIYPPEESAQGFGILTCTPIPKISAFPIFTRSGEVRVALQLIRRDVQFDAKQLQHINTFLSFTFTKVLRLQKYLMLFDADASENSFFIVPTLRRQTTTASNSDAAAVDVDVDWRFLEMIAGAHDRMPSAVAEPERAAQRFDVERFRDAVVMPWYRNQDQPQYFYVAEICQHLTPESRFPGDHYRTFREYYRLKYGIRIQDQRQPLLDVDHTSARLNFLTPRYVNRKGVALPTSSEETKRAKRENLEQKQILVPELCTIHPFPASLWRAAVCLPCILYRINALLLADEIRVQVARDLAGSGGGVAGGTERIVGAAEFEWPMLNFGWSLAEVLRKSREQKQAQVSKEGGDESMAGEAATETATVAKGIGNTTREEKDSNSCNGDSELEIGTWSNEMAADLNDSFDSGNELPGLPANVQMCSTSSSRIRYGSPTSWTSPASRQQHHQQQRNGQPSSTTNSSYTANNGGYYSDLDDSFGSDDDDDMESDDGADDAADGRAGDFDADGSGDGQKKNSNYLNIEFKGDNVAEAIDSEQDIRKRQRQLEIIQTINASEKAYQRYKNMACGFDAFNDAGAENAAVDAEFVENIAQQAAQFERAIAEFEQSIIASNSGQLIRHNECVSARIEGVRRAASGTGAVASPSTTNNAAAKLRLLGEIMPFVPQSELQALATRSLALGLDELYALHRQHYFDRQPIEEYIIEGTGDLFDQFNYSPESVPDTSSPNGTSCDIVSKQMQLPAEEFYRDRVVRRVRNTRGAAVSPIAAAAAAVRPKIAADDEIGVIAIAVDPMDSPGFSFDAQPDLTDHPGPSPSIILQALTMSNANDGINLERLETIGDSFLKYAITTYLYCTYEDVHEGKLSHLRSKQVSNLNLYRLGRRKMFGECMIATKFEPHDNWLPPCYYVPKELEKALIAAGIPAYHWNLADLPNIKQLSSAEICALVKKKAAALNLPRSRDDEAEEQTENGDSETEQGDKRPNNHQTETETAGPHVAPTAADPPVSHEIALAASIGADCDNFTCFIPYNLVTQHSIPDKSVADCVEALIGAYLIDCGQRGALLFMAWLGIRVLPCAADEPPPAAVKSNEKQQQKNYGHWALPKSPLLLHTPQPYRQLDRLLDGYDAFERSIGYTFRDRSYLLQAMTHASYSTNRLTDCYQRLEFLGDAVLDYLITRHLYEDPRQHSPGALTDLRSALVNNTIFASLAVRHGFHKYFRHLSPGLNEVIGRFVRIQHENGHLISEEFYLISEEECDEAEDVEVPKALGDVFESVAGAIFLDSNMSLDTVWRIFSNMMRPEIELFSNAVPKSPIRELLELEPETAKFSKPEKLADGRRVRVSVEVFGKGTFRGIGRNYRIAKCTAAKCALRQLKKQGLIRKQQQQQQQLCN